MKNYQSKSVHVNMLYIFKLKFWSNRIRGYTIDERPDEKEESVSRMQKVLIERKKKKEEPRSYQEKRKSKKVVVVVVDVAR